MSLHAHERVEFNNLIKIKIILDSTNLENALKLHLDKIKNCNISFYYFNVSNKKFGIND